MDMKFLTEPGKILLNLPLSQYLYVKLPIHRSGKAHLRTIPETVLPVFYPIPL
jgi:hypothetical protein